MFSRPFPLLLLAPLAMMLGSCVSEPTEHRSAIIPSRAVVAARQYGLVDVRAAIPDIVVDLRYATRHNVMGRPLYPRHMPCLLRTSTVERLRQAQATLRAQGYGLRIWDAWRPPEVQQALFAHAGGTGMFLDPGVGWSRHCGGVSLDATLVDAEGREMKMPTYFDENLDQAASHQRPADPEVRRNLDILHRAMRGAGLLPLPSEWWHFDDTDYLQNPVLVIWGKYIGITAR